MRLRNETERNNTLSLNRVKVKKEVFNQKNVFNQNSLLVLEAFKLQSTPKVMDKLAISGSSTVIVPKSMTNLTNIGS